MKEKIASDFSEINETWIIRTLESGEQKPEKKNSERSKENKSESDKNKSLRWQVS